MKILEWKKLFFFLLFGLALCSLTILYEYILDQQSYSPMIGDTVKLLPLSNNIKRKLHEFIMKKDSVAEVRVLTLNYQRNIRIQTLVDIKDTRLQKIHNEYLSKRLFNESIFNGNRVSNDEFLQLTQGEFICVPFKDSIDNIYEPLAGNYVSTVCSIGIPPYNSTLGILVVYFHYEPTKEEKDIIFLFMREISNNIYNDLRL